MTRTTEVTMPTECEIVLTRTFNVPAALVFDFHTRPEHIQKWLLGPTGWTMPVCEIDLRVGGRYRYVWRNADSGKQFGVTGQYREVRAPVRLVHTESMDGAPGDALCTLNFAETDGHTTLTSTMLFPSRDMRDQALQSGMTDGTAVSYDRMESIMNAARYA